MTATETYYLRKIAELEAERDAAYQRGREDAAAAVETLRDPSIAIPTIAMAVEAARGGSHE